MRCLTCYSIKNDSDDDESAKLTVEDVIFVLKMLLQVGENQLVTYLDTGIDLKCWISVCSSCYKTVTEAKKVYQELLHVCGRFKAIQHNLYAEIKASSCSLGNSNDGVVDKGDREYVNNVDNGDGSSLFISDSVRKFVTQRTGNEEEESDDPLFVVEDVKVMTETILACLSSGCSDEFDEIDSNSPTIPTTCVEENEDDSENLQDPIHVPSRLNCKVGIGSPPPPPDEAVADMEEEEEVVVICRKSPRRQGKQASIITDQQPVNEEIVIGDSDNDQMGNGPTVHHEEEIHENQNKHICLICQNVYRYRRSLVAHLRKVHDLKVVVERKEPAPKKSYTCQEEGCGEIFRRFSEYRIHSLNHKMGEPKHNCKSCDQAFHYSTMLYRHMQSAHGVQPRKIIRNANFKCPLCGSKHPSVLALRRHTRTMHPDQKIRVEPDRIPCPWAGCNKMYTTQEILRLHISRHEGKPGYKCDLCEVACYSWQELDRHKDSAHSEGNYACEICGKIYFARQYLQYHMRCDHNAHRRQYIKHADQSTYNGRTRWRMPNEKSGASSPHPLKPRRKPGRRPKPKLEKEAKQPARKSKLKQDLNITFTGILPRIYSTSRQCHLCGKQFARVQGLNNHLRRMHDNNYALICEICGQSFKDTRYVKLHMGKYHGAELFQCSVVGCKMMFDNEQSLNGHRNRAHGESGNEKRFTCSHCGKGFHQRYKFEQHEMLHVNQDTKPFKCGICEKGFANNCNLRYHELNTHKAERKIPPRKLSRPNSNVESKKN